MLVLRAEYQSATQNNFMLEFHSPIQSPLSGLCSALGLSSLIR